MTENVVEMKKAESKILAIPLSGNKIIKLDED